jgi:WD40 repeat protein
LGEVRLWKGPFDATNPAKPAAEMKDHRDVVEGLAFSAAGDALVTASDDERALAFALTGNTVVGRMQDHTNRVVSVAFSPGDKYVATGSLDKTVKIWSGKDYKPLANLDDTGGKVFAIAFLPNGLLAEGGEDGNLRLFRLQESKTGNLSSVSASLARNFGGNRTPILALAASAKGNWLVSGGEDHVVNVYDFAGGNRKYQLKESPEAIYSLAVSPDGTLIAAGCRDGKVRLWTTADGKPAGEL